MRSEELLAMCKQHAILTDNRDCMKHAVTKGDEFLNKYSAFMTNNRNTEICHRYMYELNQKHPREGYRSFNAIENEIRLITKQGKGTRRTFA